MSETTKSRDISAPSVMTYVAAMRPAHWVKNILLFVPALLAHAEFSQGMALALLAGVFAMSLAASAGYLVNDLIDLEADRRHASKRYRPVASGRVSPRQAGSMAVALVAVSLATSTLLLGAGTGLLVVVYLLGTLCYSRVLKSVLWLDVIVLAGFYVWRLVIGGTIAAVELSPWLVAFACALFIALALMKRLDELAVPDRPAAQVLPGRPYRHKHLTAVLATSTICSAVASLILVFYLFLSEAATQHYARHLWLWVSATFFSLWLAYVLRSSMRGKVSGDPVLFAASDPSSLALVTGSALAFLVAI